MAGPIVTCVSGYNSRTASARICAQSCLINSRQASSFAVIKRSSLSSLIARPISQFSPFTTAARAALARPGPMSAAICAAVTGAS